MPDPDPALCAGLVVVVVVLVVLLLELGAVLPGCPVVCLRVSNVMVAGYPLQPTRSAEHRKRMLMHEL